MFTFQGIISVFKFGILANSVEFILDWRARNVDPAEGRGGWGSFVGNEHINITATKSKHIS